MLADGSTVVLSMEGVRWARPYRSDTQQGPTPRKVTDVLQTGQQIWVRQVDDAWWLAQVPEVNSALVSINPQTVPLWRWSVALISIRASLTAPPGTASGGFQHQTVPLHRGDG